MAVTDFIIHYGLHLGLCSQAILTADSTGHGGHSSYTVVMVMVLVTTIIVVVGNGGGGGQQHTNLGCQVTHTKFFSVLTNIYECLVWNLFHVTLLACIILRRLLDF